MVQEQQLRHDHVRNLVVDGRAEEDDVIAQEQRVNVIGAFAAAVSTTMGTTLNQGSYSSPIYATNGTQRVLDFR
ncbi:MAG: hypothetical protein V9G12_11270 [Microthrixaceae bacterium]